jgi:hypothetical protein
MYKEKIQSVESQILQMQNEMQAGIGEYEEKLRQVANMKKSCVKLRI